MAVADSVALCVATAVTVVDGVAVGVTVALEVLVAEAEAFNRITERKWTKNRSQGTNTRTQTQKSIHSRRL